MKKIEARWQTIFNKYLREKQKTGEMFGYYELKQVSNDFFNFNKIESHQLEGLQAGENSGFVWKLSDQDMREKPFDCFSTPPLPAYLVIKFPDGFYCIRIKEIVKLKNMGIVGINQEIAKNKAEKVIHI